MPDHPLPTEIETFDTARILNQLNNDWEKGWLKVYKRHSIETLFNAETIGTTKKYSDPFFCAPYSEFELLLNITASGGADVLTIEVEVSDDNATWFKKTETPFGSLKWEGTLGNKKESLPGKCISPYYRLTAQATASGWTLTSKGVFIT